ncbi:protein RKD4 [Arachis ipaensis]|uniref:RWP-RK domain-containing protein n=2 Tax=Arachis hypogaea TaxID=3818 RepID=A0A445CAZ2_ARAHY|nr:protein RKD4 [Arachis ipaensis]XP_025667689.1 protein RKD4-like [Arachis hypogaea]QHN93690.1 hypothetical protein DS421_17g594800 [Arachis hypogaea]RYR48124.1 hypothetical protein Ahy_A07g034121 [Arachis hypogaea]
MEFFNNELDSFSNDIDKIMEISPMDDFDDWAPLLTYKSTQKLFLNDLPEVDNDFDDLPPLDDFKKEREEEDQEHKQLLQLAPISTIKNKKSELEYDEIKKHFDLPITEAASKMNIGLTLLKRRCRELSIKRWPHRKIKSLHLLIQTLKEIGLDNEVEMLEQEINMLKQVPGTEITQETKKLRQAYFKANYKRRKLLASNCSSSSSSSSLS